MQQLRGSALARSLRPRGSAPAAARPTVAAGIQLTNSLVAAGADQKPWAPAARGQRYMTAPFQQQQRRQRHRPQVAAAAQAGDYQGGESAWLAQAAGAIDAFVRFTR